MTQMMINLSSKCLRSRVDTSSSKSLISHLQITSELTYKAKRSALGHRKDVILMALTKYFMPLKRKFILKNTKFKNYTRISRVWNYC